MKWNHRSLAPVSDAVRKELTGVAPIHHPALTARRWTESIVDLHKSMALRAPAPPLPTALAAAMAWGKPHVLSPQTLPA
ncbi:MAG: hypothetical protein ACP5E5_00285 [Acidobacteriaceae bacterium]